MDQYLFGFQSVEVFFAPFVTGGVNRLSRPFIAMIWVLTAKVNTAGEALHLVL
jgi:hypothetical protein